MNTDNTDGSPKRRTRRQNALNSAPAGDTTAVPASPTPVPNDTDVVVEMADAIDQADLEHRVGDSDHSTAMKPEPEFIAILPWIGTNYLVQDFADGTRNVSVTRAQPLLADHLSHDVDYDNQFNADSDANSPMGFGLFLIIADPGVGKSTLLKGRKTLPYGEPVGQAATWNSHRVVHAIADYITNPYTDMSQDLYIDSAKSALFMSGGTTLTSGVSSQMLADFTSMSAILSAARRRVFYVMNPLTALTGRTVADWSTIFEAVSSGVIVPGINNSIDSSGDIAKSWIIRGRAVSQNRREFIDFDKFLGLIAPDTPSENDSPIDLEANALRRSFAVFNNLTTTNLD